MSINNFLLSYSSILFNYVSITDVTPTAPGWSIRETVTFLDPGFHEMKQEKFDGGMKDIAYYTGLSGEFTGSLVG